MLANSFAFPEIDLSLSISVILALCAIVSPILVAIINNILLHLRIMVNFISLHFLMHLLN